MKKNIMLCLVSFASIVGAAEPNWDKQTFAETKVAEAELKKGIFYVRFLATDPTLVTKYSIHPSAGLGYRRVQGSSAFDVSAGYGSRNRHNSFSRSWFAPKVSYLHYLNPFANQTIYLGSGLSFGGIKNARWVREEYGYKRELKSARREFVGLLGHVTAGVEWCRRDACVVMSEFGVSQPLVPSNNCKGNFGPTAELSCGLGF